MPYPPGGPQQAPNVQAQMAAAMRQQQPVPAQRPQSGLGLAGQGPAINAGVAPQQLRPADMAIMAGGLPSEERFQQGARQGAIADSMRESALEPIRGRMVGNVYVPASITEGGAKLIQAYVVRQKEKEQKSERAEARETQAGLLADWLKSQDGGPSNTDRAMITPEAGRSGR